MIKFKAKIKDSEEWIEGNSVVFETSMNEYIIVKYGMYWVDGGEWTCSDWNIIDIETLVTEKQ